MRMFNENINEDFIQNVQIPFKYVFLIKFAIKLLIRTKHYPHYE